MNNKTIGCIGGGAILFLVLLVALFGCSVQVDASQNCVVTSFGNITGVSGPGLHFKALWDGYHCYSQNGVVYETSEAPDKSKADFTDIVVETQTSDGQSIKVSYSVRYHPDPNCLTTVYTTVGQDMAQVTERVVKFYSRSDVRQVPQHYEAAPLYSGKLTAAQNELIDLLRPKMAKECVVMDDFVLRQVTFNADYVTAIEQKQIAFEKIQTAKYNSEAATQDAAAAVNKAKGEAEASYQRALKDADSKLVLAQKQAEALALIGTQLAKYPQLVQYQLVEKLNNVQWGFLPSNTLPLMQFPQVTVPTPEPNTAQGTHQ